MSLAKRTLGKTGLEVSCLGLGTVKIGRNQEVKYPRGFSLPSDEEVSALISQAKELGINFLDTAPAYGSSEQRLGRLLKERQDWIICSKVGEEFAEGKSYFDFSAEHTQRSIERSLRDIGTDYLDIVLIHSDGQDAKILESSDCLETLLRLKEKGLIRAVGMSTKTVEGGMKAADLLDLVMVTYNPSMQDDAIVIDHACELQKGVLVKKALNSGHDCIAGDANKNPVGTNLTERNLRFALDKEGVTSVIVGTINPKHLLENVETIQ
ncbi:MAG: aldo/keto reductase [SAR86 cluster bacterium]|uniref:Aldo/keto reductase n=1 Tax=SAR86 cluster bacterium TaxID=2030880 RepID=A0A2A4WXD8_9GAMM|nr:MAG: aldo/keto reductase [SAR86 cluster bacterium]